MLIDTHAHLDKYLYKRFGKSINSVLGEIEKNRILTISDSMDLASYAINKKISRKSKYIIPAFGIHPWNAHRYVNKINLVKKIINKNKFIGEIGLDYFFIKDKSRYPAQRKIFKMFLEESEDKIISVHTKGAENDAYNLLKESGNKNVIIHWYSGSVSVLDKMIKERYYFSISPELAYSPHIKEIVKIIPTRQILTETDNPGGPLSYTGKIGTPVLIKDVIENIAKIKGTTPSKIEKTAQENYNRLTKKSNR